MATPVNVIAELVARPEQADAARKLLTAFAARSRSEPGCLGYEILEVEGEPGRFMTFETWTDAAAVEAHMNTDAIKAALPLIGPMLAKPFAQVLLRPAKT